MDEPLDESYLKWLYSQVASVRNRNPARTYWSLIRQLFTTEFTWSVPNDDNRVEDGRDLRLEFIEQFNIVPDREWMAMGCSMLEMLIGLSRRLAFESEGEVSGWFWHLMDNLDLRHFNDRVYSGRERDISDHVSVVLDQVIRRKYEFSGRGGLFPLKNPNEDQRDVELWYQMAHYLLERI